MRHLRTACLRKLGLVCVATVVSAGCDTDDARISARLPLADLCSHREDGSRWAAPTYQRVSEYGRTAGEEILDAWGVAAFADGTILVYDAGSTSILHLDSELRLERRAGGEGRGPGEFAYQRMVHGEWIATAESSYVILTSQGLQQFGRSGEFQKLISRGHPFGRDVPSLGLWNGAVLYGVHIVDRVDGRRALETWITGNDGSTLVRADSMPALPVFDGRAVRGGFVNQAEPLWASHGNCVFIADGSSDWLIRVDLSSGRSDTLALPAITLPKSTREDERQLERLRSMAATMGINAGSASVKPTAPLKWNAMIVDPDGYIWLEPWRPPSMSNQPLVTWLVHPNGGVVDSVEVNSFPKAFLNGHAFISQDYDGATGATYVSKHMARSRR